LHVVDASHPSWESQVESVNKILADMPIAVGPTLLVFNKIDRAVEVGVDMNELKHKIKANYPDAVMISAIERQGLDILSLALTKLVQQQVLMN
jgi:GTPase